MYSFSPSTLSYLTEAGWYAERKVSTIKYRAFLIGEGYAWFPQVAAFLAEFGDLSIRFNRRERKQTINLDACDVSARVDPSWVTENYAKRIGQTQLCAIGATYTEHLLLFMDNMGSVYGGFDDFLCFIGSSGADAIEAICSNRQTREIA